MAKQYNANQDIMTDHVLSEIKEIVSTLVVKQQYIADRYETVDMLKAADRYISAYNKQDTFYSHPTYSIYALNKAGLFDNEYLEDKTNIPSDKRETVLEYEREYIIANYTEENNYYRSLMGLPDVTDNGIKIDKAVNGVDINKYLHEMTDDELLRLSVDGILAKTIEDNPDKKYLKFLTSDKKISNRIARRINNFEIMYINKDANMADIVNIFIALYRNTRNYVMDKFYDTAYEYESPYYEAFMGLFILSITVQRYITQYFQRYINRDFYDKDIIKRLFESYNIPFYNNVPLSYLQKVVKNLNRLLYCKGTDEVFVDIFKIFGLTNIDIYNYVLFKDRQLDINGKPIFMYEEKTQLDNYVDTITYRLTSSFNEYMMVADINLDNLKEVDSVGDVTVYLFHDGSARLGHVDGKSDINVTYVKCSPRYDSETKLTLIGSDLNFKKILRYKNRDTDNIILFTYTGTRVFVTLKASDNSYIVTRNPNTTLTLEDGKTTSITDLLIGSDFISDFGIAIASFDDGNSRIYIKGHFGSYFFADWELFDILTGEYSQVESLSVCNNGFIFITKKGTPFVWGNNAACRLHFTSETFIDKITNIEDRLNLVYKAILYDSGTLFIMKDGTVRMTGSLGFLGNEFYNIDTSGNRIVNYMKNVIDFQEVWGGSKTFYIVRHYNGKYDILNYSYSDNFGYYLFSANTCNPRPKIKYMQNIKVLTNGTIIITAYETTSYLQYAGLNDDKQLPYISTDVLTERSNQFKMKKAVFFKNTIAFIDEYGQCFYFKNTELTQISVGPEVKIIDIMVHEDLLYILTGHRIFYTFNGTKYETYNFSNLDYPVMDIKINGSVIYIIDSQLSLFLATPSQFIGNMYNVTPQDNMYLEYDYNSLSITLFYIFKDNKYVPTMFISKLNDSSYIYTVELDNLYSPTALTVVGDYIILDGFYLQYIKLSDIVKKSKDEGSSTISITLDIPEELNAIRSQSAINKYGYVIYDKMGGITLFKDFMHNGKYSVTLASDDYISIGDGDNVVDNVTFSETDLLQIIRKNKVTTYEEIVESMYKFNFIEVPLRTPNMAEYLANNENWLDYNLVVSDDALWGGDIEKSEFLHEALKAEFNYCTSKYISVNSRYEIVKLNFELCYIMRLMEDLKDVEENLILHLPYAGDGTLFEVLVTLFALTCKKFGFAGNIMDTTTKNLSVLGFNFNHDGKYLNNIYEIMKDGTLLDVVDKDGLLDIYGKAKDEIENNIVKEPNAVFTKSADVINSFLDNEDVYYHILDAKYSAKTIHEYNAYKLLLDATATTKYSTSMYKDENGNLPKTYLEYLKEHNFNFYKYVEDTTDDNLLDQLDNVLVTLNNYLDSDRFEYIFLNNPTLSVDNIRQFITYLINLFKSYTVELKSMNVIYHLDEKRIHNIKLILQEKDFEKEFIDYTHMNIIDVIDYAFGPLEMYTLMKMSDWIDKEATYTFDMYLNIFKKVLEEFQKSRIDSVTFPFDFADRCTKFEFYKEEEDKITIKDSITFYRSGE